MSPSEVEEAPPTGFLQITYQLTGLVRQARQLAAERPLDTNQAQVLNLLETHLRQAEEHMLRASILAATAEHLSRPSTLPLN